MGLSTDGQPSTNPPTRYGSVSVRRPPQASEQGSPGLGPTPTTTPEPRRRLTRETTAENRSRTSLRSRCLSASRPLHGQVIAVPGPRNRQPWTAVLAAKDSHRRSALQRLPAGL